MFAGRVRQMEVIQRRHSQADSANGQFNIIAIILETKLASLCCKSRRFNATNVTIILSENLTTINPKSVSSGMVQCAHLLFLHCVSKKNDNDVLCYNFNAHQPILIIFGRCIAEWICY